MIDEEPDAVRGNIDPARLDGNREITQELITGQKEQAERVFHVR